MACPGCPGRKNFYYSSSLATKRKCDFSNFSFGILMMLAGDIELNPGPSIHHDINEHCSTKGLKMFHFDEIRDILLSCNKIDIFGLTETFLADNDTANYEVPGFTLIKRNRKSGPGGKVCVYVRDGLNFELREDLQCDEIKSIFLEIMPKKLKHYIVSFLYKLPESSKHLSKNFDRVLSQKLELITTELKECIILSDLNVNYNNTHQKAIKNNFIANGFEQLIKSCTRITPDSETLIDVILTNAPNNISRTTVIVGGLSDHNLIACTRKMNNIKHQPSIITFRDFSDYIIDTVNNELLASSWDSVTISASQPIYCGVPQGSILGPLLFIVYFNDAVKSITGSEVLTYADDTVIFCSHKNINTIKEKLELDFNSLGDWLYENELIINYSSPLR